MRDSCRQGREPMVVKRNPASRIEDIIFGIMLLVLSDLRSINGKQLLESSLYAH